MVYYMLQIPIILVTGVYQGMQNVRTILYSNDKFDTYGSKSKADRPEIRFDQIAFFGKTANIEWSQITKRYHELKSGTIGDDIFPPYDLTVITKEGDIPLAYDMIVTEETLEFYCRNTTYSGIITYDRWITNNLFV